MIKQLEDNRMKVLVVGGGGREHALVWRLAQSSKVDELYCAPGNPGMIGQAELVDIGAEDIDGLLAFAKQKAIDLTVVGPEAVLVAGITDIFEAEGLAVAGPCRYAAQLEGSKSFCKDFMTNTGCPPPNTGCSPRRMRPGPMCGRPGGLWWSRPTGCARARA
jgi:phosphoribosylamine--glycine ligase